MKVILRESILKALRSEQPKKALEQLFRDAVDSCHEGFNSSDLVQHMTEEGAEADMEEPIAETIEYDAVQIQELRERLLSGEYVLEEDNTHNACVMEAREDVVNSFFTKLSKPYLMQVNEELLVDKDFQGEFWSVGCEDTGHYYAMEKNKLFTEAPDNKSYNSVGLVVSKELLEMLIHKRVEIAYYDYFASYMDYNDSWLFYKNDAKCTCMTVTTFGLVTRLFSRNTGLLESDVMVGKTVLLAGCGSVGSLVALELARAGVGGFVLVDPDTLEMHNICRHQLGVKDLGKRKVDAMKEAILNVNPKARVTTFYGVLKNMPAEYVEGVSMIVSTGDNRACSAEANELAERLAVPFVATGLWERAHAGECFYWYPGCGNGTYREAFEKLISEERPASHSHYFAAEESMEEVKFEPGTSTDITYVTSVALKVVYDLLNKDNEDFTHRVLDYLTNYTLICNTNKPQLGGEMAEAFPHPLFISTNVHTV